MCFVFVLKLVKIKKLSEFFFRNANMLYISFLFSARAGRFLPKEKENRVCAQN